MTERCVVIALALTGATGATDPVSSPAPDATTSSAPVISGTRPRVQDASPEARFLQGRFDPADHPEFVRLGRGRYLHRLTAAAYERMRRAARRDGVRLRIRSATRNFAHQRRKWRRAWRLRRWVHSRRRRALRIMRYLAAPGTSRHHWGTDVDLCCAGCRSCFSPRAWRRRPRLRRTYGWLRRNALRFGFCQPYRGTPRARSAGRTRHGYQEERWHWSFRPLARLLTYEYLRRWRRLRPRRGSFPGADSVADLLPDYIGNVACSASGDPLVSPLLPTVERLLTRAPPR